MIVWMRRRPQIKDLLPPAAAVVKVLTGMSGLLLLALAVKNGLLDVVLCNPNYAFMLLGAFVIHLWSRPGWGECFATIAAGVMARLVLGPSSCLEGYPGGTLLGFGPFLGLSSLSVLAVRAVWLRGVARTARLQALFGCGVLSWAAICLGYALRFSSLVRPRKYDLFLYAVDGTLGFQPSFLLGRLLATSRLLWDVASVIYYALPLEMAVVYAAHLTGRQRWPLEVLKAFLLNGVVGFTLYFVYPAAGPIYAFPGAFPLRPPAAAQLPLAPLVLQAPPNAMPSLHFSTALLAWWNCRPWKWGRLVTGLFLVLTLAVTLGLGEHYLIDLVVALPFALAIQAAAAACRGRRLPGLVGAALTAFWLAALFIGVPVLVTWPMLACLLGIGTVTLSLVLERRLARTVFEGAAKTDFAPAPPITTP